MRLRQRAAQFRIFNQFLDGIGQPDRISGRNGQTVHAVLDNLAAPHHIAGHHSTANDSRFQQDLGKTFPVRREN